MFFALKVEDLVFRTEFDLETKSPFLKKTIHTEIHKNLELLYIVNKTNNCKCKISRI